MARTFSLLTRSAMRALPRGRAIHEHGIEFKRLPDGDAVFSVNIIVDGQRIHRVVGRETEGTTRTQAEAYVERLRQDAKNQRLCLPKGRKTALSLRQAATGYLQRLELEGGKDLAMKRRRLRLHLVPFFGDRPLSQLTTFEVERYKRQRREEVCRRGGDRRSSARSSSC